MNKIDNILLPIFVKQGTIKSPVALKNSFDKIKDALDKKIAGDPDFQNIFVGLEFPTN